MTLLAAYALVHFIVGVGSCSALQLQKWAGTAWTSTTLYADTQGTPKLPRVADSDTVYTDSGYVFVTTSGAPTQLRLACAAGPASNVLAVIPAGAWVRDTTWYAFRSDTTQDAFVGLGIAGPQRTLGIKADTLMWVETLDAEQLRRRVAHLRACGYYWQHGTRVTP